MAKSTDLAVERAALLDTSKRKNDGKVDHTILPWQVVTYSVGGPSISGIEPVDAFLTSSSQGNSVGAQATEKQITDYQSMTGDQVFHLGGCGGDGGFPKA